MRYGKSDWTDGIAPLIWILVIVFTIGKVTIDWLGVKDDNPAAFWLAILSGAVAVSVVIAAIWAIYRACRWLSLWRRCPHGVKGGLAHSKCSVCLEQRERDEQKKRAALEEWSRRDRIRTDAGILDREESERIHRERLSNLHHLREMGPLDFELCVCELFEKLGYRVEHTPFTNDGGKDAIMWQNGTKCVLECKRYKEENHVGRPELQKFFAAMMDVSASWGVFVTTSSFTETAREYAKKSSLNLVNGQELVQFMQQAYPADTSATRIRAMCLECGDVVTFSADAREATALCSHGHVVNRPIIQPRSLPNADKKSYYRHHAQHRRYSRPYF